MFGTLLVAQSGAPTPVVNASLAGLLAEARGVFERVLGLRCGIEGALKEDLVDLTGLTDGALERLARTPGAALGSGRFKLGEADFERALKVFRAHGVRHFAYIGGNGSMFVCERLAALDPGLRVVGVPKTIDNDLVGTDHTPGYGSAARFVALATRDAGLDLAAMVNFDDIVILEAMGRDTGWLAAASALFKRDADDAPHLVCVPEIPFDEARVLEEVAAVHARLGCAFVVLGEGIRDADGEFVGHRHFTAEKDALGRVVHSLSAGASSYLADRLRERMDVNLRILRPGTIGRASSVCVSETDRREAWSVGAAAVRFLAEGGSGEMISLVRQVDGADYRCAIGTTLLRHVASATKTLPREYMDAAGTLPSEAFRAYALPLVGAPPDLPETLLAPSVARRLIL